MSKTLKSAMALLEQAGIPCNSGQLDLLTGHCNEIRRWNSYASLVSQPDLDHLTERHVVDALSLVPVIQRLTGGSGLLLDIGSGGGFPAIPLRIMLPAMDMTLIERSAKKAGVIRQMLTALQLDRIDLIEGAFPECLQSRMNLQPGIITARAVEKPDLLHRKLAKWLPADCTFLCQHPDAETHFGDMFHVEHYEDDWSRLGLRRGSLYLIHKM